MKSVVLLLLTSAHVLEVCAAQYQPTWTSLDTRPLPKWYDDAKFGIFVHWGVYSVPSFGDEWFWQYWQGNKKKSYVEFMQRNYYPGFTYADFASEFTAEFFDPHQWAELFEAAGARYVVLTTKHHEGFTLWPSKYSWNWNAVDIGPKRDLVHDLSEAIRQRPQLHFGVYHSMFEWFNPMWLDDQAANFSQRQFAQLKTIPELYELVNGYRPEIIWSDGSVAASSDYWGSRQFLAWLYNHSPVRDTVVVNDRWGKDAGCKHGDFFTCQDRYNPGRLLPHKWENCMTVDRKSWGFRRDVQLADILTIEDILAQLVETVSYGGNLLLNVGPTHDGRIVPIFEERLRQVGTWLKTNGAAIYGSRPWKHQNDTFTSGVWYTYNEDHVFAAILKWPDNVQNVIQLESVQTNVQSRISMLATGQLLSWTKSTTGGAAIELPRESVGELVPVLKMKNVTPKSTS